MQIIRGKIQSAQKIVIYGPEGIGKSTFASQFPNPLFIDTEGSTKLLDVARLPKPTSWTMLLEEVKYVKNNPDNCSTLAIDTADWAERLCAEEICAKSQKSGIEDFGYGKGYVYLEEEFGRLLNALEELVDIGINVVFTAHAQMRKFEQPDEMGSYDRWEMKLEKKTAPLLKEWADMVLFANYKTYVINVDNQGVQKGKNKAQGGKRVMYTSHHPCWDAKNRHGLAPELELSYSEISHCIPSKNKYVTKFNNYISEINKTKQIPNDEENSIVPVENKEKISFDETGKQKNELTSPPPVQDTALIDPGETLDEVPKALIDLMKINKVTLGEIKQAVTSKGYYPEGTPFKNYDPDFVDGVLIGAWQQVYDVILSLRDEDEMPF